MRHNTTRIAVIIAALTALLVWMPRTAMAGSSGTDSVSCGCSSLAWNAPNGYVVSTRGEGPVKAIIDSLGESRTHTMISNGTHNYMTHATMRNPGQTGWPTYCSTPLEPKDIWQGRPGITQINMAATYQYNYEHGSPIYIRHQSGSTGGVAAADWSWYNSNYDWVAPEQGSYWYYLIRTAAGDQQYYVFYQYIDAQGRNAGGDNTRSHGAHCSLAQAYFAVKAGWQPVSTHTYTAAEVDVAGNALYHAIEDSCNDSLGWFMGGLASVTCFEGICDDAARQMRACFAGDWGCDTDSNTAWNNLGTATTLSPDDLLGWYGHDWGTDKPYTGPYTPYNYANTAWNSAGSICGCWF